MSHCTVLRAARTFRYGCGLVLSSARTHVRARTHICALGRRELKAQERLDINKIRLKQYLGMPTLQKNIIVLMVRESGCHAARSPYRWGSSNPSLPVVDKSVVVRFWPHRFAALVSLQSRGEFL